MPVLRPEAPAPTTAVAACRPFPVTRLQRMWLGPQPPGRLGGCPHMTRARGAQDIRWTARATPEPSPAAGAVPRTGCNHRWASGRQLPPGCRPVRARRPLRVTRPRFLCSGALGSRAGDRRLSRGLNPPHESTHVSLQGLGHCGGVLRVRSAEAPWGRLTLGLTVRAHADGAQRPWKTRRREGSGPRGAWGTHHCVGLAPHTHA